MKGTASVLHRQPKLRRDAAEVGGRAQRRQKRRGGKVGEAGVVQAERYGQPMYRPRGISPLGSGLRVLKGAGVAKQGVQPCQVTLGPGAAPQRVVGNGQNLQLLPVFGGRPGVAGLAESAPHQIQHALRLATAHRPAVNQHPIETPPLIGYNPLRSQRYPSLGWGPDRRR